MILVNQEYELSKRVMRILHISKYYYPFFGGVENICRYLVENMPQYDIAVVCFSTGHKDVIEDVHGIKVYRALDGSIFLVRRCLYPILQCCIGR